MPLDTVYRDPDYVLARPDLVASVHPKVAIPALLRVALDLDRRANFELNVGRHLIAEKLSRRAQELREITTLDDNDILEFKRCEMDVPWVQDLCIKGGQA